MKYRHCDGKLVLKVTNDRVVRLAPPHSTPPRLARRATSGWPQGVGPGDSSLTRAATRCAQCLKFETDQAQDVKRLEKLNSLFFSYMCGKDPHDELDGAPTLARRTVRTLTRLSVLALILAGGRANPDPPPRRRARVRGVTRLMLRGSPA